MFPLLVALLAVSAPEAEPQTSAAWLAEGAARAAAGDAVSARAAYLQAAFLDEARAPEAYLAAGRLAEAEGDSGAAWWMYRRGLLSPSASGATRDELSSAFVRLGGAPAQAEASDAAPAPAPEGADRTPRFVWDVTAGWSYNDNRILRAERIPAFLTAGQVAGDAGQFLSADLGLVFPIDDRSQWQVGFTASGNLYNDIPSLEDRLLVGSLGYARALGKRWLVEVAPYIYDDAIGHDRYLYAWGNTSRVTFAAAPRWSIRAGHTYERDRYPNSNSLDGPVWSYSGELVFRPDADREGAAALAENEFRIGHHRGVVGPRDATENYDFARYVANVEYDLFPKWHLDAELVSEERDFDNHLVGGPASRGRRQDNYWSGEIGLAYRFLKNWRLRGYYSAFENTADSRQNPPDHYKSDEVGLQVRWTGWRPVVSETR